MPTIGESDYRSGARERLEDARLLLAQERFSGAIYLAGRAVEGMLRAVIWKSDPAYRSGTKSLETGHDLRELLKLARSITSLRNAKLWDAINDHVANVAGLWSNNMRFLPVTAVKRLWYNSREIGGRRTIKESAREFVVECSTVVHRCEALWRSGQD